MRRQSLMWLVIVLLLAACGAGNPTPLPSSLPSPTQVATSAPHTATARPASPASVTPASTPTVIPATDTPPGPPAPTATLGPTSLGRTENFELLGHEALNGRGWNAGLALNYPCAYLGSRRAPAVAIVDVSDPAHPTPLDALPLAPGSQPVELRAVPDLGLLVVLNFSPDLSLITFDVHDCAHPRALGALALGASPHEFYLWRDPAQPARVLLFVAMWGAQPDLHVVDLSDPAQPRELGSWTPAAGGVPGILHSLSLSPDGRLAYLALWGGGFLMADTSDFALGRPNPALRVLAPLSGPAPLPGLHVHSTVPLPDPRYVFLTQEVYNCPFAGALIADVADPARPRLVSRFDLPEQNPACAALPQADAVFTAHNPLVAGPLVFVTWYGGGLQALDVGDPANPRRVGLFVPDGSGPGGPSPYGKYPVQLWSYPILRQGVIYVSDIVRGLYILRYTGPVAAMVNAIPLAEGNASRIP